MDKCECLPAMARRRTLPVETRGFRVANFEDVVSSGSPPFTNTRSPVELAHVKQAIVKMNTCASMLTPSSIFTASCHKGIMNSNGPIATKNVSSRSRCALPQNSTSNERRALRRTAAVCSADVSLTSVSVSHDNRR
jgi:hypothetical protein